MSAITQLTVLGRKISFDASALTTEPPDETCFPDVCALALDVSGSCNLQCTYCAESMTLPQRQPMAKETLSRAVEALFAWSNPAAPLTILFGNGEPLLHAKRVKAVGELAIGLARQQDRQLTLSLTTNGTLLKRDIRRWLIKDGWEVKVSLDGGRADHDRHRIDARGKGSYGRIKGKLRKLAKAIPQRCSTTAVFCKGSDAARIIAAHAALGVRSLEIVPVAAPPGSPLLPGKAELLDYRRFIAAYAKKLLNKNKLPALPRLQGQLRHVLGLGNKQIVCGAGRNFFAVGREGQLYPCYRFVGLEQFILGNLESGPNQEAVQRFTAFCARPRSARQECNQCWAAPLCNGPCFAATELLSQGAPPEAYCAMVQADSEAALWLVDKLRTKNPVQLCQLAGIEL